jgi:hypothetical protein
MIVHAAFVQYIKTPGSSADLSKLKVTNKKPQCATFAGANVKGNWTNATGIIGGIRIDLHFLRSKPKVI